MNNSQRENELPIGAPVDNWQARPFPPSTPMNGRFCSLEPINIEQHCSDLFNAFANDPTGRGWTYLPNGPFTGLRSFQSWMETQCLNQDPLFYAAIDPKTNKAIGMASYLRIAPEVGVIEVGHIHFSPSMQRTPASTEAMFLMMQRVFDELGYRRYEWKCDSLNQPSRGAAERLGFTFEGIFRQALVYKGRNRDTAWYSVIDKEWNN